MGRTWGETLNCTSNDRSPPDTSEESFRRISLLVTHRPLNPFPRLPPYLSRFLGYRPQRSPPFEPLGIPPFCWLICIPLKYEVWITSWVGSFIGILLVEAIMSTNTIFRDVWHSPIIITSFGATAVLIYGVSDSPLSQPRNLLLGHGLSAVISVLITRLFALRQGYTAKLDNAAFQSDVFINGALSMSTALLVQLMTGTVHPPGGATALAFATDSAAENLSWRYIVVILSSALIMFAWALLINNVGRRRYPIYWWNAGPPLLIPLPTFKNSSLRQSDRLSNGMELESATRQAEDGGRTLEAYEQEQRAGTLPG